MDPAAADPDAAGVEGRVELLTVPTTTDPVDGAFHPAAGGAAQCLGGVVLFHGNTMNFYQGPPRFLAESLSRRGFACLALNRRGHDVVSTRASRSVEGGAFQRFAEAVEDGETAVAQLAARGQPDPVVVGHSNGGLLAAVHAARHPETRALVLLSAHAGGADSVRRDSAAGLLCGDRVDAFVARARDLVGIGRGDELLLLPGWWRVISADSLVDRVDNTPDLLELAPAIDCPTLVVRGEHEDPTGYPTEAFAELAGGPVETAVVAGADHFYVGREAAVAEVVGRWLLGLVADGNETLDGSRPPGGPTA